MSLIEQRSVIKFLTREGESANEIQNRLANVYGPTALKISAVKKWSQLFRLGRESVEDDPRPGSTVHVLTQDKIEEVRRVVLDDRRLKKKEIAKICKISETSVLKVLHEHLGMNKVCARWVPKNLSAVQKADRVTACREFLNLCGNDPDDIISRLVTGDETWVHMYDPESKMESMEWRTSDEGAPKKFKVQSSAGKVMATIFWDCKGILLIDYLEKGKTVTGEYYANVLKQLREAIKEKRRGKLASKVLLLHDNAPAHGSRIGVAALAECGFEPIRHPPYSPDLAPSDYFLFQELKKKLRGTRFSTLEDLKVSVSEHFDSKSQDYFSGGLFKLVERCHKCIQAGGEYFEK